MKQERQKTAKQQIHADHDKHSRRKDVPHHLLAALLDGKEIARAQHEKARHGFCEKQALILPDEFIAPYGGHHAKDAAPYDVDIPFDGKNQIHRQIDPRRNQHGPKRKGKWNVHGNVGNGKHGHLKQPGRQRAKNHAKRQRSQANHRRLHHVQPANFLIRQAHKDINPDLFFPLRQKHVRRVPKKKEHKDP